LSTKRPEAGFPSPWLMQTATSFCKLYIPSSTKSGLQSVRVR
jgi:hypothetical protein